MVPTYLMHPHTRKQTPPKVIEIPYGINDTHGNFLEDKPKTQEEIENHFSC